MRIVAGTARGRKIEAPPGNKTRPTLDRVRENLFNMLQGYISDSRVLDLFAGSGALSMEAISRGALSAVLVDSDKQACIYQHINAEKLGFAEKVNICCSDWHKVLPELYKKKDQFDIVFLDPPYAMTDMNDVFQSLIPLINNETLIILEHQSGIIPSVPEHFELIKQRKWGFCSVDFYRIKY